MPEEASGGARVQVLFRAPGAEKDGFLQVIRCAPIRPSMTCNKRHKLVSFCRFWLEKGLTKHHLLLLRMGCTLVMKICQFQKGIEGNEPSWKEIVFKSFKSDLHGISTWGDGFPSS